MMVVKIACLYRPRTKEKSVGLGIFDSAKNLKLGIYTEDGFFGIKDADSETLTQVKVTSDEIRLEIVFAPSSGFYKAYTYQGNGREELGSGTEYAISTQALSYGSWKIGADSPKLYRGSVFYTIL